MFPGERDHDRTISDNTVNAALRRMGFDTKTEITGHGFRATARTMLAERLGWDADVIEAQLAHSVKDPLGRAYNRTQFHDQRRAMLQAWQLPGQAAHRGRRDPPGAACGLTPIPGR